MRAHSVMAWVWLGCAALSLPPCATAQAPPIGPAVREQQVPAGTTSLYMREVGRGETILVLHGGPDFDHRYLLPDLDRWSDRYRLIYYDQRGRGRSAQGVRADEVNLASELEDLDHIRRRAGAAAPILLGHSWGAVLALEYAMRHPERVSRLVLMNPAPVAAADLAAVRTEYLARLGGDMDRQRAIRDGADYRNGDPDAVAARYRIHFKPAVSDADDYERLMATMHTGFTAQGSAGILLARAVEDRLMQETWNVAGYDLSPRLRALRVPTLVIAGRDDFMVGAADRIARSIPGARLVALDDCGHFAYLECAAETRAALDDFVRSHGD